MNPKTIMQEWSSFLQSRLCHTHQYQVQALAAFSWSAAYGSRSHLSRLAAGVPGGAKPPSALRRLQRLIHNPRIKVEDICDQMAFWLTRFNQPGKRLCLFLDETPHHNNWRVVKVSVGYRRRALPLVWRTDAFRKRPHRKRVMQVLQQCVALVKLHCPLAEIVLLADRGLCWPAIIDLCEKAGWNYVLRAQSQTRFVSNRPDSTHSTPDFAPDSAPVSAPIRLGELVKKEGQYCLESGRAFAKAGWREVNVVACWRPGSKEKWILVSNLPPTLQWVRWYAHRMWHEQSFRDEKSHGFDWNSSKIKSAEAVHRFLLILALAQLWLTLMGSVALTSEWAQKLGLTSRSERRRFSVFRHGWNLLQWCILQAMKPPCHLDFEPT